jgi:hypothetical protein
MQELPSSASVLDTVPLTIDENQIIPFKFYFNHAVRTGMRHDRELYALVGEVAPTARLEAYRLGCEWLRQGLPILITVSRSRYALWLDLREATTNLHDLLQ